jgi:hypothetical protein
MHPPPFQVFLDVPKPFTWIIHDPSGTSECKPMDGVEVEEGPAPEKASGEGEAAEAAAAAPAAAAESTAAAAEGEEGAKE